MDDRDREIWQQIKDDPVLREARARKQELADRSKNWQRIEGFGRVVQVTQQELIDDIKPFYQDVLCLRTLNLQHHEIEGRSLWKSVTFGHWTELDTLRFGIAESDEDITSRLPLQFEFWVQNDVQGWLIRLLRLSLRDHGIDFEWFDMGLRTLIVFEDPIGMEIRVWDGHPFRYMEVSEFGSK